MLQDYRLIRHYQVLTDALVELWSRGYRQPDEMRMLIDGYLLALRTSKLLEPFEIFRIEEEVGRFMYDPSNFTEPQPEYR
ncbi:MAG: hypothetical protein HC921_16875 [Synechococcaceae cyanobacterium SM2_3_1]|nr:hypothetical protein [Synechococcaceae cyanobacterium SM2_3_1]